MTMMSTFIFTAVLAAVLAVPGLCGSPAGDANSLKPTITMPLATPLPHWNPHVHAWNPVARELDGFTTFTGSVPKPTETFSCDKSVGAIHHATNGKGFQLACNATFTGHDLSRLQVAEWAECVEACSVAPGCKAFTFVPILHDMINCYLKDTGNPALWSHKTAHNYIGWLADSLWTWTTDVWTTTTVVQTSTTVVRPSTTIRPTETQAPLIAAAYNELNVYHQLESREDASWHKECYGGTGAATGIETLIKAATFFCRGGAPEQPGFGGLYPDGVLVDGDGVTLEWTLEPDYEAATSYAIYVSVITDPGCAIDFNSLDIEECVDYFSDIICSYDPVFFPSLSTGGYMQNDCFYLVIDPNAGNLNERNGTYWYYGVTNPGEGFSRAMSLGT